MLPSGVRVVVPLGVVVVVFGGVVDVLDVPPVGVPPVGVLSGAGGLMAASTRARILSKSGRVVLMLSSVNVRELIEPFWTRWTRSTQAGRSARRTSVVMLSLATCASWGYLLSMVVGLTWSRIVPMRQRWRRIREKSSVVRRDRANQRALWPSSSW